MELTEEDEKKAKRALTHPSALMTGKEEDFFTRGGYITLQGVVEKLQVARMIDVKEGRVPILDMSLRCGDHRFDISLWRDVALRALHLGDKVELSHLKAVMRPNGSGKLNSSTFTCVKITDPIKEEDVKIIAVTPEEGRLSLLASDFEEYILPTELYAGSCYDLLKKLPLETKIVHANNKIINIHNPEQDVEM